MVFLFLQLPGSFFYFVFEFVVESLQRRKERLVFLLFLLKREQGNQRGGTDQAKASKADNIIEKIDILKMLVAGLQQTAFVIDQVIDPVPYAVHMRLPNSAGNEVGGSITSLFSKKKKTPIHLSSFFMQNGIQMLIHNTQLTGIVSHQFLQG